MPKFHVENSFILAQPLLFCLSGKILEGTIRKGMVVCVPVNSQLSMDGCVHSIEFARKEGGAENVVLTIKCDSVDELKLWQILNIKNEEIEVS